MGNNPDGTRINGRPGAAHHGAGSYGNTARCVRKIVANLLVSGAELTIRPLRGCACHTEGRRSPLRGPSLRGWRLCRYRSGGVAAFDPAPQAGIRTALLAAVGRLRFGLPLVNMRPVHPVV